MALLTSLRLNAVLSFATGFLLAAAPGTVGSWLGVSIDGWLRLLGMALLGHGALLVWASQQSSITSWGKLNLAAIAPYPLIMIGLAATGLVDTSLGRVLVLLDGTLVGLLALLQWTGLRDRTDEANLVPA